MLKYCIAKLLYVLGLLLDAMKSNTIITSSSLFEIILISKRIFNNSKNIEILMMYRLVKI